MVDLCAKWGEAVLKSIFTTFLRLDHYFFLIFCTMKGNNRPSNVKKSVFFRKNLIVSKMMDLCAKWAEAVQSIRFLGHFSGLDHYFCLTFCTRTGNNRSSDVTKSVFWEFFFYPIMTDSWAKWVKTVQKYFSED